MKCDCPQCASGDTGRLYISSSVVVYLKCHTCGSVFTIDRERPWAEPFTVSAGHRRDPEGEGGGNSATS